MTSSQSLQPVVECIALTKVFHDFWNRAKVLAVDNLDLEIRPGEVFGLLGPNGSGKSTTIKMLLGLLYPTSGAARVFGQPPTDTAVKARIGFMPEESYLYRYLNASETLDYYGRLFRLDRTERKRRTEQLIEMVGLKRAARRPVGTYSKGMQRRIGLAQALINDPDFLILDEPTTGLDPIGTRQIKDLIRILGSRGKTVLLCSHLLGDVEDVCNRVAIMYGGRRQALGTVQELLTRQDVTQITTTSLEPAAIERVRSAVAQSGGECITVEHPTERLESFFLQIVNRAQRDKIETSGAESSMGVSAFLGGNSGTDVVESLVKAGSQPGTVPQVNVQTVPIEVPPKVKTEVVGRLTGEPVPKKPTPKQPDASDAPARQTDKAVIDRLLQTGGNQGAPKPPSPEKGDH